MSAFQVLLVAGTHGNEINAPWLLNQWANNPELIKTSDVKLKKIIGNPEAFQVGKRYLDRDLNRSFRKDLLEDSLIQDLEVIRARELLLKYGPKGSSPCQMVIDFHSTTSSMGSCVVIYGRRAADLAFAGLIQARLGLPIYLHEADQSQTGFLVESWPCGLVIEIGPVPQSLLQTKIVQQSHLVLEICLEEIAKVRTDITHFPKRIVVHRHIGSLDFPRDSQGNLVASIHNQLQGKDWYPLQLAAPLFLTPDGEVIRFKETDSRVPVFINEASYLEKNIAMSLCKREVWSCIDDWESALIKLINS